MKWSLIWIAFPLSAVGHEFPSEQVERHCRTAMHYITYTLSECVLEQYDYYDQARMSEHYQAALWYGQHRDWTGRVVGVDFKLVLDRVNYLNK